MKPITDEQIEQNKKATIISLFPLPVNEYKPGIYPGYFTIPAAPMGSFSYLVVGDAVYYQETKSEQIMTIKTSWHVLADSIVMDFQGSHIGRIIGAEGPVAEPGFFWVPGAFPSKSIIESRYKEEILESEKRQLKWFEELVKIADDTYNRTRSHASVSQLQRLACERLGISRPYMLRTGDSRNTCPFCFAEVPYGAIKCPNCREILNKAAYDALVLARTDAIVQTTGKKDVKTVV